MKVDVLSVLAFLEVMPGLEGIKPFMQPIERSKTVTLMILLPGTEFRGLERFNKVCNRFKLMETKMAT